MESKGAATKIYVPIQQCCNLKPKPTQKKRRKREEEENNNVKGNSQQGELVSVCMYVCMIIISS